VQHLRRSLKQTFRPQGHVFRGWWLVGAGGTVQFLGAILFFQAFGAYFLLIEDEFGWSKALLAGAFSLARLESGMLGPLQGWMIDRYGPRAVIRWGLVIFGLALIGFSQIESILEFYVYFFFIALGTSLGGFLSVTTALVNWFSKHRAKALAFSQLGFSFGGILVPVTIFSLETVGWRSTAVASGILVLIVAWPLTRIIDHRPEDIGEMPDGLPFEKPAGSTKSKHPTNPAADRRLDYTAREALRTRAFWFMALGHGTALVIIGAVMVHLILHLNGRLGYSLTTAGLVISLLTGTQIIGQICAGFLGDRFDKRLIVCGCMGFHAAAMILLAYAQSLWMIVGFAVLHGIAWGTRGPLMQAIRADYFGASNFGAIMGWSSLVVMMGMALGPLYAGYMADRTGSYVSAFATLAVFAVVGGVFFLLAKNPPQVSRGGEL
jgi:MFS family permease